ncbi:MAG: hypothetical protein LUF90_08940 [Rikenellaceae bacterium]|nr:hypothetical protein [Rikenellaceae bacterium]
MNVLRLKWDNNGTEAYTLCIATEDMIVYDNFIINTFIVNEEVTVSNSEYIIPRLKSNVIENGNGNGNGSGNENGGDIQEIPYSDSWVTGTTISWLFNNEWIRGYAYCYHSIWGTTFVDHVEGKTWTEIQDHKHHGDSDMQMGSRVAKTQDIDNYRIAYVWGLATPFVSMNFSFLGNRFDISFSGLGSSVGGEGINAFIY